MSCLLLERALAYLALLDVNHVVIGNASRQVRVSHPSVW